MTASIGFIGLGSMGYRMCTNVHEKMPSDGKLFICDVNQSALHAFVQETKGQAEAKILKTPKDVAQHADTIITMLPRGEHVQQVFYAGEDCLLSAAKDAAASTKKLFIDCSTIDPDISREISQKVEESGLGRFSDAAVSGGPGGAAAGTLTHMIGCPDDLLEDVKSIVHMTGTNLFHCGPVGAGATVKLINNYMAMTSMLVASEGINMGRKMGIPPSKLTEIINVSSGGNWAMVNMNPCPGVDPESVASKGYKPGFAIELASGTVDLAIKGAEKVGAKLALGEALQDAFHKACEDERCKSLDCRSIYRWVSNT